MLCFSVSFVPQSQRLIGCGTVSVMFSSFGIDLLYESLDLATLAGGGVRSESSSSTSFLFFLPKTMVFRASIWSLRSSMVFCWRVTVSLRALISFLSSLFSSRRCQILNLWAKWRDSRLRRRIRRFLTSSWLNLVLVTIQSYPCFATYFRKLCTWSVRGYYPQPLN